MKEWNCSRRSEPSQEVFFETEVRDKGLFQNLE